MNIYFATWSDSVNKKSGISFPLYCPQGLAYGGTPYMKSILQQSPRFINTHILELPPRGGFSFARVQSYVTAEQACVRGGVR